MGAYAFLSTYICYVLYFQFLFLRNDISRFSMVVLLVENNKLPINDKHAECVLLIARFVVFLRTPAFVKRNAYNFC